jgi:hypothetical protein
MLVLEAIRAWPRARLSCYLLHPISDPINNISYILGDLVTLST